MRHSVTRFFLLCVTSTMALGLVGLSAANAQSTSMFHRGVAIHDAMNWATMRQGNKLYAFPPFSDAKHALSQGELTIIRRAGFDFVRLTIDPGPFLQFQ